MSRMKKEEENKARTLNTRGTMAMYQDNSVNKQRILDSQYVRQHLKTVLRRLRCYLIKEAESNFTI